MLVLRYPSLPEWIATYQQATKDALGRNPTQVETEAEKVVRPVLLYADRVNAIRNYFAAQPNLLITEWLSAYQKATQDALKRNATHAEIERGKLIRPVMLYIDRLNNL